MFSQLRNYVVASKDGSTATHLVKPVNKRISLPTQSLSIETNNRSGVSKLITPRRWNLFRLFLVITENRAN
jgi:hypothetical protein